MLLLQLTFLKSSVFSIVVAKGLIIHLGFKSEAMTVNQPRAKHKWHEIIQPYCAEKRVKGRSQGKTNES